MAGEIKSQIDLIAHNIREKARQCGRAAEDIKLLAVTKTVPPERIIAALDAGIATLGENYLQEALPKIAALTELGKSVEWHMIGHLQTRKAALAIRHFTMIHSVDSWELALEINKRAQKENRLVKALIEVNTGGEPTKNGVAPDKALALALAMSKLDNVALRGLMTMPPWFEDPEKMRPYFRCLRELKQELQAAGIPPAQMQELSMGMSGDYLIAIEEGATIIRIGQGIFGKRPKKG